MSDAASGETGALRNWLVDTGGEWVSSDLCRVELMRAVRRAAPGQLVRARAVLDSLVLVQITTEIFEEAGRLDPEILRVRDALHVAAALALGDDLESLVTYDERLGTAARAIGISCIAPA